MSGDSLSQVLARAIIGCGDRPRPLTARVNVEREESDQEEVGPDDLTRELLTDDKNAPARVRFQLAVAQWDAVAPSEAWTKGTSSFGEGRRLRIYESLKLSVSEFGALTVQFPRDPGAVIIEGDPDGRGDWKPWYQGERISRSHYWDAYSGLLAKKWDPAALARLDTATSAVVSRLADPTWSAAYQSKGLVVGYVQSGKTANFTGVLAKAIDAGYRLIIVLTGTIEMLRSQTQRRLDMELIGEENILGGIDRSNEMAIAGTDYVNDQDWVDGKFLKHEVKIHERDDIPGVRRLSTRKFDYKKLRNLLPLLDFRGDSHELKEKSRPLYDDVNLFGADVRIAVVKKNSTVLKRLVEDLGSVHTKLGEIPTLIVDDEADQASINTKKRKKTDKEEVERTAINQRLSDLLKMLPRAQYLGYTATPFANVFVDPEDTEDIFPSDYIISLDRPSTYMGGADFHDLESGLDESEKTLENSNERAYVRNVTAIDDIGRLAELQEALDSFVLSGAIKLFRADRDTELQFRHHTMLVHESVRTAAHREQADELRELWLTSGHSTPTGIMRLADLWARDYSLVSPALAGRARRDPRFAQEVLDLAMPSSFKGLIQFVGLAVDRINEGTSPVIVVNGDKERDYAQDALDFQARGVWKILVGGAKLSRGFTVEGLTVTYYGRRTLQADTPHADGAVVRLPPRLPGSGASLYLS